MSSGVASRIASTDGVLIFFIFIHKNKKKSEATTAML